jgi:hypothetical protein
LSRRLSLGGALFLALLAATLVTAVVVVRARDPDLALEVTRLAREPTPTTAKTFAFNPGEHTARITFFVRESDPDAFVGIVGEDHDPVRTLDSDVALEADLQVTYEWDGRDDAGEIVAPESYYLRVELPNRERDMVWPKRIKVFPVAEEPEPEQAGG